MSFWKTKCPKRQAGYHRHDATCTDGHLPEQCCFCGAVPEEVTLPDMSQLTPEEYSRLKRVARGVAAGYYKP